MSDLAQAFEDIRTVLENPRQDRIRVNGHIPFYEIQDPEWCRRNGHPHGLRSFRIGAVIKLDGTFYVVIEIIRRKNASTIRIRDDRYVDHVIEWHEFAERVHRNGNGIVLNVRIYGKLTYSAKTLNVETYTPK